MKALRNICIFFSVLFGFVAFACVVALFSSKSMSDFFIVLFGAVVMAAICVLLVFGAKKANDNMQETGSGIIAKTKIIDAYGKTSTASAAGRGAIGGFVAGPVGAVIGASTAKQKRSTTFLVFYKDGKKSTVTVQNNSLEYQKYIKYLDD